MTAEKPALALGWRVYGLGVIALALVAFAIRDFDPGQPVPKAFPDRQILAYAAAGFLLVAGAAMEWRRTLVWASGALAAYYTLLVVVVMDGRVILRNADQFMAYSNTAEQLAIAAGAVIVFATYAKIDPVWAGRLTKAGQVAFGISAILFGGAHFAYMGMTAPLVPRWLPPSQLFWGYATGVFHIAAGVAILTGIQARLAAILLTVMFAAFTPLVHVPLFLADPTRHFYWTENATNLVLIGAAWVVADSLARRRRGEVSPAR
ncbi:hypothetical protein [Phenylobacterium sp.]|uniref:hypothetical protein n=1 Tax=Phenylobacterium sp. TaxID=1871053 RepID=UPI0012245F90|nr:hypothetical protein [Phenylobacterium sp.]THD58778.1 MAG: DoxX family membrane protein [Phenylobacterium sp.]